MGKDGKDAVSAVWDAAVIVRLVVWVVGAGFKPAPTRRAKGRKHPVITANIPSFPRTRESRVKQSTPIPHAPVN